MFRSSFRRIVLGASAATVAVSTVTAVPAAAATDHKLASTLEAMWVKVFQTPSPDNPFLGGDPCLDLGGRLIAPFASTEPDFTCRVKTGTRVFVTAWSSECSTVEPPPYFGSNEVELRQCARDADKGYTLLTVTVDDHPVPVHEVETRLIASDLPADNIFGPYDDLLSVAHGWVALLRPLPPGSHEIVIHVVGTNVFGEHVDLTTKTTLIVERGR
jgi:hypothetical protein